MNKLRFLKKFDMVLFIANIICFIINMAAFAYFLGYGDETKHYFYYLVMGIINLVIGILCLFASISIKEE